jgi:hypothetical protein
MVLSGAVSDELVLKLGQPEQRVSLLMPKLYFQIERLAGIDRANGNAKTTKTDVADKDERTLSTESEQKG